MNPYHYLYYRLYCLSVRQDGHPEDMGYHNIRASIMLAAALLANLATIYIVLTWIPGLGRSHITHVPLLWIIVSVVAFYAPHYAYFTFRSKYRQIVDEQMERLGRSAVYGRIYFGGSVAMFLVVLFVGTFIIY